MAITLIGLRIADPSQSSRVRGFLLIDIFSCVYSSRAGGGGVPSRVRDEGGEGYVFCRLQTGRECTLTQSQVLSVRVELTGVVPADAFQLLCRLCRQCVRDVPELESPEGLLSNGWPDAKKIHIAGGSQICHGPGYVTLTITGGTNFTQALGVEWKENRRDSSLTLVFYPGAFFESLSEAFAADAPSSWMIRREGYSDGESFTGTAAELIAHLNSDRR